MNNVARALLIASSLSAAGLVGLVVKEGYTSHTIVPVAGDRPTNGFGSTFDENGKPIKLGDTVTPQVALKRVLIHSGKDKSVLDKCVTGPVSQVEADLLVDFAYNYGATTTCNSSIVRNINAGNYAAACESYLKYKFVAKRDCSIRSNGCYGVWTRSQERAAQCRAAQ